MLIEVVKRLLGLFTVLGAASACTGVPSGLKPVVGFEADRYMGTWYEIARLDHSFERGLTNVTATYTLREDGSVAVVNRGLERKNCDWQSVEGDAEFQGDPEVASLSVTFFWPFAGGYHVISLDRENYRYALVSGPTRDYLWLLARTRQLSPEIRERLVEVARRSGFEVSNLIWVDQSQPPCPAP